MEPVAYRLGQQFDVLQRKLTLPLKYLIHVIRSSGGRYVPFFQVPYALRMLQPWGGHQGDVAKRRSRQSGINAIIGLIVGALGSLPVIRQISFAQEPEFFAVVAGIKMVLIKRRLAAECIEKITTFRHHCTGWNRNITLGIHEYIALFIVGWIELLRHHHWRAVIHSEWLPTFAGKTEHGFWCSDANHIESEGLS